MPCVRRSNNAREDEMPGRSQRWRHWLGMIALTAALAGCETTPPPPLMSPLQVAKSYGYADAAVGDNRYQVTYVGPNRRSLRSVEARQAVGAAERTQAFDFALWRAAQIAIAQGF